MDGMAHEPEHAKPARRDHLWAPLSIAAASGLEVCATWTGIGSRSGFPVIRLPYGIAHVPTDFCLMVCMEAYSAYALLIWLRGSGRRSGPFAMCSGIAAIVLSLVAQVAYHVTGPGAVPPRWLVGLVSALPVVAVLLAVILMDLVRLDREEAAEAGERTAVQAEMDALRAGLAAAREVLSVAHAERDDAQRQAAEAAQKADVLARKLAAKNARNARAKGRANQARNGSANSRATKVPDDVDARAEALAVLAANPDISGAELGLQVGKSRRWGQLFLADLAKAAPRGQDPQEG